MAKLKPTAPLSPPQIIIISSLSVHPYPVLKITFEKAVKERHLANKTQM